MESFLNFKMNNIVKSSRKTQKKNYNQKTPSSNSLNKNNIYKVNSKNNNIQNNNSNKQVKNNSNRKSLKKKQIKKTTQLESKKNNSSKVNCNNLLKHQDVRCFNQVRTYKENSDFYKHIVNKLSLWGDDMNGGLPQIVGTGSNKLFKYPGDIDMMQTIRFKKSNWEEYKKNSKVGEILQSKIQHVIENIMLETPNMIFVDFKGGYEENFNIYYNELLDNNSDTYFFTQLLSKMVDDNLLTKKCYKVINKLLKNLDLFKARKFMTDFLKRLSMLKWNITSMTKYPDISLEWPNKTCLQKALNLLNDIGNQELKVTEITNYKTTIFLKDIFEDPKSSRIKIDIYVYDPTFVKYLEVTNVYILKLEEKKTRESKFLTENFDAYFKNLNLDFYLYLNKKNILKCTKRLYNLSKSNPKNPVYKEVLKMTQIHKTWISKMSQLKSTIEILIDIFDKQSEFSSKENSLFKDNKKLFKVNGNFTSLQNLNSFAMKSYINNVVNENIPFLKSFLRSWHIFENNTTFLEELVLQEDKFHESNVLKSLLNLEDEFNNKESEVFCHKLNLNRKLEKKKLKYSVIRPIIVNQIKYFDEASMFINDLIPNFNKSKKEVSILLNNNWVYFDDKFWIDSYKFFTDYNKILSDLINEQTNIYFKQNLNINNPIKHLLKIRNLLDPKNKIRNSLISEHILPKEFIENVEKT